MSDEQIKTDPDIAERLRSWYITNTMADAADEIERLRNRIAHLEQALDAFGYLKAINTITAELGPKASGPDDIADALRKEVGR